MLNIGVKVGLGVGFLLFTSQIFRLSRTHLRRFQTNSEKQFVICYVGSCYYVGTLGHLFINNETDFLIQFDDKFHKWSILFLFL